MRRLGPMAALLLLAGCAGRERVVLNVSVPRTELSIQAGPLGTYLSGQLDIRLDLGANAPESTTATLRSLKLLRASDDRELVPALALQAAAEAVTLDPGDSSTWSLALDATAALPVGIDEICAEPVVVSGSVADSAAGGPLSFVSLPFTPAGCP